MDYRPCLYLYGMGSSNTERKMAVETLVYQNQGNGKNAGWYRPKECEAVGIIASKTGLSSTLSLCGARLRVGQNVQRDTPKIQAC